VEATGLIEENEEDEKPSDLSLELEEEEERTDGLRSSVDASLLEQDGEQHGGLVKAMLAENRALEEVISQVERFVDHF
jgi:hypothetical protein